MTYFIHRNNGMIEQMRFIRQQPHSMRHVPFDFELRAIMVRQAIIDFSLAMAVIVWVVGIGIFYG